MNIIEKFKKEFKSLKLFDIIWLIICTIGITIVSVVTNNSILAVIASIMGVIYVILNGCRLSVAFLFGIINTFVYGIVSYQNGLYGDFMLNVFYSCPCCIVGLIAWIKASKNKDTASILSFNLKQRLIFLGIIIISIISYGFILSILKDTQPYLDATTTVLSISAYICLIMRKKEVWYLFNFSNILSIVMWFINYLNSGANIAILFMYIIYTSNSILNTFRWEKANRKLLEIDILYYKNKINLKWMNDLVDKRDDIIINIYQYKQNFNLVVKTDKIKVRNIPEYINNYGSAYNYIIKRVKSKYFMLLDNTDYLDVKIFNKVIKREVLNNDYDLIKSNKFTIKDDKIFNDCYDDFNGTNEELEEKILDRKIFTYFFGSRIYRTKIIKKYNIRFSDTDVYNDLYPNIVLIRNIDINNIFTCEDNFYVRNRMKWESFNYNEDDLKNMIRSLLELNVPKNKILMRLVDSYNYSINVRGTSNKFFIDAVSEFFDIKTFNRLVKERNSKEYYTKK